MLKARSIAIFGMLLMATSVALADSPAPHLREADPAKQTGLDRYVAKPDDSYRFEVVNSRKREGYSVYILDMVSQHWRSEAEVDRVEWQHWITVTVPEEVKHDTAFVYIGGGKNDGRAPKNPGGAFMRMARDTGSVVAELGMIPNQPLTFKDDGKFRSEDSAIAYTWDKYMRTGDEEWPLRMPMTKAVVRAMDTIQTLIAQEDVAGKAINNFVVAGGSKRGWTTWTTAIVDSRVKAIAPIVIDMLNVIPSFRHHYDVYGFWAPAVGDYVEEDIMARMETPEYKALMDLVEPYSYRDRLTMPKYILSASQDQFFLPDSSQFYWDDLKEVKRLRYVPNVGHSMGGSDVFDSVASFYASILTDTPLPEYAWTYTDPNTVNVSANQKPTAVILYTAHKDEDRDFRIDEAGKLWEGQPLEAGADGSWTANVPKPEKGWTAYMVELSFAGPGGTELKFTTPIRFSPETTAHKYEPVEDPIPGFLTKP